MSLSDFLTRDNLIFFLIWLAVLVVFIAICFFVIRAIFKLVKAIFLKIFKKKPRGRAMEGALSDKGEDISLYVEELEKSKKETAIVQNKEQVMPSAKAPPLQYYQPEKSGEKQEKGDKEKEYAQKEQKDIEAGLEKLKSPDQAQEKKSFLEEQAEARYGGIFMPKIKIPVSKKHGRGDLPVQPAEEGKPALEEQAVQDRQKTKDESALSYDKNQIEIKSETPSAKPSIIKEDKTEAKTKDAPELSYGNEQPEIESKTPSAQPSIIEKDAKEAKTKDDFVKTSEQREASQRQMDGSPLDRIKAQKESAGGTKAQTIEQQSISSQRARKENVFKSPKFFVEKPEGAEAEKQEIPLYEKPDFMKDELGVDKTGKQTDTEAGLEKLKHPDEAPKKKLFLEEQSETIFGDVPVPEKIKIPVLKEHLPDDVSTASDKEKQTEKIPSEPGKEKISLYEKPDFMKDELGVGKRQKKKQVEKNDLSPIERAKALKKSMGLTGGRISEQQPADYQKETDKISLYEKPDFMKNELRAGAGQKGVKLGEGSVLFGDKEEISRIEMRRKLRRDPEVWKAQKDVRLNLNPLERVKLEKIFFSKIYGRNISKKDVKMNLRRMGKEWASTSNLKRKETLRRQIKFLKNISGIKDPHR